MQPVVMGQKRLNQSVNMEMDPMPTNRRVLTWLCAYSAPESINKWTNLAHIAFTLAVCVVIIEDLVVSAKFINEYVRIDLEITLYAVFQMVASFSLLYLVITSIVLRYRIRDIFESLKNIYKASGKEGWSHLLDEMNQKCEWIWKMYAIFVIAGFLLNNVMMSGASIVYCLMTYGGFDTNHLYTAYKVILPWSQTTKLGYFFEIIFSILVGDSYFLSNGSMLLLFISICLHHLAFYNRFKYLVSKLGDSENPENCKKLLCDLIRFHNLVKDWLLETTNIYSPFILVQLISSVLILALIVFHLDLQMKHIDLSALIILIGGLASTANLFLYCYFGTLATESYQNMAERIFESNWLKLPVDSRKYLIVMIANAQRPIYYHGSGLARLKLETFAYLIKTAFSYYMMVKTLTKNH